jgi:hypothetical protein
LEERVEWFEDAEVEEDGDDVVAVAEETREELEGS